MKVYLKLFPLTSDYVEYDIAEAKTKAEAAYLAVRQTHECLDDENHTYETKHCVIDWGGKKIEFDHVKIFANEKSHAIAREFQDSNGYWFAVEYR